MCLQYARKPIAWSASATGTPRASLYGRSAAYGTLFRGLARTNTLSVRCGFLQGDAQEAQSGGNSELSDPAVEKCELEGRSDAYNWRMAGAAPCIVGPPSSDRVLNKVFSGSSAEGQRFSETSKPFLRGLLLSPLRLRFRLLTLVQQLTSRFPDGTHTHS